MCSVTDKLTVNMDRLFAFRQSDGTTWRLRLFYGKWFEFCDDRWLRVDERYLDHVWYLQHDQWLVLGHPCETLNYTQKSFYYLAFELLPMWDLLLQKHTYSSKVIKDWSHYGCTRSLGDVGNCSMAMTLQLCHSIRHRLGASELWELKQRNKEHASDQLEAIMGLRELDPNWKAAGNCVDHCCAITFEVWDKHYEADETRLSSLLGLRDLVDHVIWHRNTELIIKRRAETRAGGHTALYRKLPIEVVLKLIVSYC